MNARLLWPLFIVALLALAPATASADTECKGEKFVLVVHGGAGAGKAPPAIRARRHRAIRKALRAGERVLKQGGSAIDAVTTVVTALEDDPLFNAGRGGIPNRAGFVELDSSIMDGRDRNAGAVAATRTIKNPILAARAVMEHSEHVMFVGRGADEFARTQGFAPMAPKYFLVPHPKKPAGSRSGTVGAVALDRCGHLAAGTSTGGYNTKTPGRVGDSPIIGAGTFADDRTCAVSATGWGEYFIRWSAAHDIAALLEYKGMALGRAARTVLEDKLRPAGATGGVIAVDRHGNVAMPFTTRGMARGYVNHRGEMRVGTFKALQ
jgi:beta-aspartyl-peptidase (threonine type)